MSWPRNPYGSWLISSGISLISLVPLILFFAPALRRFLLDQSARPVTWPLPLSRSVLRLFQFLWPYPYSPGIVPIMGLFALMIAAQTGVGSLWSEVGPLLRSDLLWWSYLASLANWGIRLIELYLLLRLSFLPIRLVLGEEPAFRSSWRQTKGNGGRLLLALLLAQLPVFVLTNGLYLAMSPLYDFLLNEIQPQQVLLYHILRSGLIGLLWVLTLAVWAAVTTAAFHCLTGPMTQSPTADSGAQHQAPAGR